MIAGDESAARRLTRATDQFGRKKSRESSLKLGLRIGFSLRREKKTCLVGFTFISAANRPAVVEKQMPIALIVERRGVCPLNEFLKVSRAIGLSFGSVREETQHCQRKTDER